MIAPEFMVAREPTNESRMMIISGRKTMMAHRLQIN